jgi:hypothetical protein
MAITNVMIPMIKRIMPGILANQITGIHPMPASTGSIFTVKNNWLFRDYNKKYWPHQFIVENDKRREVEKWCWNHFNGWRWHSSRGKFVFKKADDAMLFKVRWECRSA